VNALVRSSLKMLARQLQRAGPYLLLELLLPGGTLFALLLFLYRNRPLRLRSDPPVRTPVVMAQVIESARRIALLPHGIASFAAAGTIGAPPLAR
jgi:hypothetical protein